MVRIILCGILLASAMFCFIASISIYKKKDRVTRYFSYFTISLALYSLGYAMELYSNSLHQMLVWNLVQYIGLPFLPAFWVMFTLEYNNKPTRFITKLSIFLIPVLTFIFRYTSNLNHLYYFSVQVISNNYFSVLYIEKGPWYWVNTIFITACFVVSTYMYFNLYRNSTGSIRHQSLIMLIAALPPWIAVFLNLFNLSPFNIDYAALALTGSVILLFIAFLRYQFLNIKPLARDKIFELTNDGIIVLDTNYKIIDFNPSAAYICSLRRTIIGQDVYEELGDYKEIIDSILNCSEVQCHIAPKGNYKINTIKISEPNNREVGYILTLTDTTKHMEIMEQLNRLASIDDLTGVFNRRYFFELSSHELEKAKRYNHPISLLILDLDFFKQINDNYGHQAGDAVLKQVADICAASIRSIDILGRYGGEEFIILFPETTLEACRVISNRISRNIAETPILYEGKYIKITASIGITGVDALTEVNLDCFLKYADKALYRAKSDGRNCVRSLVN